VRELTKIRYSRLCFFALQCFVDKNLNSRATNRVVSDAILFNSKKLRVHPELDLGSETNIFAEI
jgi:hypothetical protein